MELSEVASVARNFAVMVRLNGPDPKGQKMRRHAFYHSESGKTTLSASGLLLPDSFNKFPIVKHLKGPDGQRSSASMLIITCASIVEPFLSTQHRDIHSQDPPQLISGAQIDVMVEMQTREGDSIGERDTKNPSWLSAQLLALVDVPASSLAVLSLIEAHSSPMEHGSWEVGWSLAPVDNDSQSIKSALQTQVGKQRHISMDESSKHSLMAMSTTRVAFLRISTINSRDLSQINISPPRRRGDLILVMGSPFGVLSPLHFFNSISVGTVANCCPSASSQSPLLMADIRCLPGMEGGPVFDDGACLVGILARPLRQKSGGAEIQLVVTWDSIARAQGDRELLLRTAKDRLDSRISLHHLTSSESPVDSTCRPSLPFERAMASVVLVTIGDGAWASGIILNTHGLILTNAHLLEPWRFGKAPLLSGVEDETKLRMSPILSEEAVSGGNGWLEMRQSLLPTTIKIAGAFRVGDELMVSSAYKSYRKIRVRLDHMEHRLWCDARALYVSKGPLDIALLQLETVPCQLCPITPNNVCPSPGSKAYVIGHGLFGPRSDLCPSVSTGVVARVVKTQKSLDLSDSALSEVHKRYIPAMLETTAAVHPGGSGGGVFNSDGQLIGLVTSNARHGGGTVIPHLNFSIPCAALEPVFKFSQDMQDMSILQVMDRPNEHISSVWALMPPLPTRPSPPLPYLPESLFENKEGKGSRFAKFVAEKHAEISLQTPPQRQNQFVKQQSTDFLPSKI